MQVNSHGVISIFFAFQQLQPGPFPRQPYPLLVPYWAFGVNDGQVFYRVTDDNNLLSRAASDVFLAFPDQEGLFFPTSLIIATWSNLTELVTGLQVYAGFMNRQPRSVDYFFVCTCVEHLPVCGSHRWCKDIRTVPLSRG